MNKTLYAFYVMSLGGSQARLINQYAPTSKAFFDHLSIVMATGLPEFHLWRQLLVNLFCKLFAKVAKQSENYSIRKKGKKHYKNEGFISYIVFR